MAFKVSHMTDSLWSRDFIPVMCNILSVVVKEESRKKRESKFSDRLLKLMREMFGVENVNWSRTEEDLIEVLVDSNLAILNTKTLVRHKILDDVN